MYFPSMAPIHDVHRDHRGSRQPPRQYEYLTARQVDKFQRLGIRPMPFVKRAFSHFTHPGNNSGVIRMANSRPPKSSEHAIQGSWDRWWKITTSPKSVISIGSCRIAKGTRFHGGPLMDS